MKREKFIGMICEYLPISNILILESFIKKLERKDCLNMSGQKYK